MGKYLGKILLSCLLGLWISPLAISASLPEGAVVKVRPFTFPKAAYTGSDEEANRLSEDFYGQLITALEEMGLQVEASSSQKEEKVASTEKMDVPESDTSKPEPSEEEKQEKKSQSTKEISVDEKEKASEQKSEANSIENTVENTVSNTVSNTAENDQLMQLVEAVEKEEKAKLEAEKEKNKVSQSMSGPFVMTGTITQFEELVGVPVSTGNTKRSRVEVTLLGSYKVVDPSGKTIILEKVSTSASRVVLETMDIYTVLQSLGKKTFFDAAHNIAERLSGKKRVQTNDEAEPGSEEDDYADSPGKQLKSKSGRMKWIIN